MTAVGEDDEDFMGANYKAAGAARPPGRRGKVPDHGKISIGQESILRMSVSAEHFSDKFSSSNFGRSSTQNKTDVDLYEYYVQ
jgi:hypothetical protein